MTAETSNARGEWVLVPREVVDFLMGEGELQGAWFGETPTGERGQWFWRKHLRHAKEATPPPPADAEVRARELLAAEYQKRGHGRESAEARASYIERHECAAFDAIASALSQQPEPKPEAEVRDDDIDDEHSCVAGGPAWQEGFNAGRATGRNEALDELRKAPPEARDVVDDLRRSVAAIGVVGEYLGKDTILRESVLDLIDRRVAALTEARNV